MSTAFTPLDWSIVAGYLLVMAVATVLIERHKAGSSNDYFLAGNATRPWLVTVSVLATTQSAATFLGAPDYGYRSDFTYLSTYLGALIGAAIVCLVLIPKLYALRATTVYELLEQRFDRRTMRVAGLTYLIGRVLAGGARLYLAAIAVSMTLFGTVDASGILWSSLALMVAGFLFTFVGGLRSVLWNDLLQFAVYVGAAVAVFVYLLWLIPAPTDALLQGLRATPEGVDKLRLFDWTLDPSAPFAMLAVLTGMTLLYTANYGLDQDTTQRLLACRDSRAGQRALYTSAIAAIPIIALFVAIGQLLYVFYQRPDLMQSADVAGVARSFQGTDITVFMHFILTEIPPGLRGLVAVGVIAAAVSTITSGVNSMASVIVEDFYRPWKLARSQPPERHFVTAGRVGMLGVGAALFAMSIVCYFWQRYSDMPLLEFALAVMTFAYAGLLGVYAAATFTRRGSPATAIGALATGFIAILALQSYSIDALGLPAALKSLAFPWQLCIGASLAFAVCVAVPSPGIVGTPARAPRSA
jgi:SSS family transporter